MSGSVVTGLPEQEVRARSAGDPVVAVAARQVVGALVALQPVQSVQASNELLEFNSMMGVTRAFIASANNPVRGLLGGAMKS